MSRNPSRNGFTLIELMVGLAVVVILIMIAAPSMRELIVLQRLKSINAELVTDIQYARGQAVVLNRDVQIRFQASPAMTCYTLLVPNAATDCNCLTRQQGSVCLSGDELRTIQIPAGTDVQVLRVPVPGAPTILAFNRDGMRPVATDYKICTVRISSQEAQLLITVNALGRPTVSTPPGTAVNCQ